MCLYGHEIDETTTLFEANLGWITKLNKGDFIGRDRLARQKEEGIKRKLVGFEVTDRGIARDGQDVLIDGQRVGQVTSGSPAPFLKKNIGMAYIPVESGGEGGAIEIDVRGGWSARKSCRSRSTRDQRPDFFAPYSIVFAVLFLRLCVKPKSS